MFPAHDIDQCFLNVPKLFPQSAAGSEEGIQFSTASLNLVWLESMVPVKMNSSTNISSPNDEKLMITRIVCFGQIFDRPSVSWRI